MTEEKNTVPLAKKLSRQCRTLLKEAMASIDFTSKVKPIRDEEDDEIYYCIEKNSGLRREHIMVVDDALIACCKLYSDNGVVNTSSYYRKVSRMVFYALYELESREMLQNEIDSVKGVSDAD